MENNNQFQWDDKNWYENWMKQSKSFFETVELRWLEHPQEHLKQIEAWLDTFKTQLDFSRLTVEQQRVQEKYQTYWKKIAGMYQDSADLLTKEWIKRTEANHPIKSMHELYSLWLDCCHDIHQKTLQSKDYQTAWSGLMQSAIQYWRDALGKRE